jgi:hypothetical protein
MFEVNASFTFHKDDGSEAKPPYARSWAGLEKVHVVEQLERGLMRAMLKMNDLAADINRGKAPRPTTTDPVELRLVAEVLEDGVKWTKVTFEWPKMGEEQQSLMIGMVNGELSGIVDKEVRDSERKQGKKAAK